MDYDVLVVGSGIAGMESAIKLGDMGKKVLMVEREGSVGGRVILLSKVFPTLDCASCITTPRMAASIHHDNITPWTYSEVEAIRRNPDGSFKVTVQRKARYVDEAACTGCQLCEPACTVAVPDEFNYDLIARRAAYIPFPQAVPKKAVIQREGTSPCTDTCPAGIKAHGYVSLTRSGKYEEAFQLILEATPLVGTLGRACYAPCEGECTRGDLEGTLPIRRIKRFVADRHYASYDGPNVTPDEPNGKAVAIVGSGPAGLTAAWQLARKGYRVKIFEADKEPGGFLRYALPTYRLPQEVVAQDIANVTALGVEIAVNAPVQDLDALKLDGFDAVLLATGTPLSTSMGVPGEQMKGVLGGLDFLRDVRHGTVPEMRGKKVVIVGGGNVAMDAARTSRRLGAQETLVAYRRGREEMPAHKAEVDDAEAEGVKFQFLVAPVEVVGDASGKVTGLRCQRMELGQPDASGRRRPQPVPGSDFVIPCDVVVAAIGMSPDTAMFTRLLSLGEGRRIKVDAKTLQTEVPYIFAAGDVVTGPSDITQAVGHGRRAAHFIDRWLQDQPMDGFFALDDRLAVIDKAKVMARQKSFSHRDPVTLSLQHEVAPQDFHEIEPALTEEEALRGAGSCLDCGVCSECGQCVAVCPPDAIHLDAKPETFELEVGAVVLATGFKLFDAALKEDYGFGKYPNVITATQMDRQLAPTRPFNNILRPSDGRVPDRIAYVSCVGSRDKTVGNPLCSKICCMYTAKQNQLIMGALPLADVSVHYMDVRAAGKRYEEFYEQAKAMGANYIKGRVSKITELENGNLILRYEDIDQGGAITEAEYDLVVLAVGVQPNHEAEKLFPDETLHLDDFFFVNEQNDDLSPGETNLPGVFVAGAASGAKDIVDSILHAGSAVAQAASHLEKASAKKVSV